MNSSLSNRARRPNHPARRLLCERLERRYAMHAMPWGLDWLGDTFESQERFVAWASAHGEMDRSHCDDERSGMKAEGESDYVTGNLIPDSTTSPIIAGRSSQDAMRATGNDPSFGRMNAEPVKVELGSLRKPAVNGAMEALPPSGSQASAHPVETLVTRNSLTGGESASQIGKSVAANVSGVGSTVGSSAGPFVVSISTAMQSLTGSSAGSHADGESTFVPSRTTSVPAKSSPDVSVAPSVVVSSPRSSENAASSNLLNQTTTSYASARGLSTNSTVVVQPPLALNTSSTEGRTWSSSSDQSDVSDELRAVVDSLAQRQAVQRSAAERHGTEQGWDNDLAIDSVARGYRDVVHADGLLELATRPERMAGTSSQEAYAAIEQNRSNQLSMTLVQVGMVREFDLAGRQLGTIDQLADPEKMLTETTAQALAAVDYWHEHTHSDTQIANDKVDGENSVLNRSLLPLSFLTLTGLLISSRRRYKRAVRKQQD